MRKLFLLVIIVITSLQLNSQILYKPDSLGLDYFNRGSESLRSGKYLVAETLLTLSLDSYKNSNVYFNRALARFMIQDTIGFCEDMDYAATKYFDQEADVYFNRFCCTEIDTIFYNRRREVTNSNRYRYYEIIRTLKYTQETIGTYHDKKSWKTVMAFDVGYGEGFQAYGKATDIIAAYNLDGDRKCYYKTTSSYSYINEEKYFKHKNRAKNYFKAKYKYLKNNNDLDILLLMYKIYFNELGKAYKCELIGSLSDEIGFIIGEKTLNEIEKDIVKFYPLVNPAKFFNEDVSYVFFDFIVI